MAMATSPPEEVPQSRSKKERSGASDFTRSSRAYSNAQDVDARRGRDESKARRLRGERRTAQDASGQGISVGHGMPARQSLFGLAHKATKAHPVGLHLAKVPLDGLEPGSVPGGRILEREVGLLEPQAYICHEILLVLVDERVLLQLSLYKQEKSRESSKSLPSASDLLHGSGKGRLTVCAGWTAVKHERGRHERRPRTSVPRRTFWMDGVRIGFHHDFHGRKVCWQLRGCSSQRHLWEILPRAPRGWDGLGHDKHYRRHRALRRRSYLHSGAARPMELCSSVRLSPADLVRITQAGRGRSSTLKVASAICVAALGFLIRRTAAAAHLCDDGGAWRCREIGNRSLYRVSASSAFDGGRANLALFSAETVRSLPLAFLWDPPAAARKALC
ncbi:hypothetical protein FH972_024091 [Carpinus fangiana]|uniref:Uncharacterized protein n=1 Tax=Carpinus fangiana TaxID=176857 RepID=A0A5N6KXQ4_9ROSI|nr:hypothetical protein FH972_024091 [Carpinus fangiana]